MNKNDENDGNAPTLQDVILAKKSPNLDDVDLSKRAPFLNPRTGLYETLDEQVADELLENTYFSYKTFLEHKLSTAKWYQFFSKRRLNRGLKSLEQLYKAGALPHSSFLKNKKD